MKYSRPFLTALAGAACVALGLAALPAHAQSFVNGSFELDNWNTGGGPFLNVDASGVTGWTAVDPAFVSAFFIEGWNNANGVGPTPFGNQWIALGEEGQGGNYVEQTVGGFTVGSNYSLTLSIASETLDPAILGLSLPGSSISSANFTAPAVTSQSWDTWQTFSYNFTADAASLTFRFTDASNAGNTALGLDNISVAPLGGTAVPEPDSVALVLTASALLAGLRRKSRTAG